MRQLLLGSPRRRALRTLGLALLVAGCTTHTLMPKEQVVAIDNRDRALVGQAEAIQAAIRQSGHVGALVFFDARDASLVVLPGDNPADAWARHAASPESATGRVSVPEVLSFVYRADVPKAPETVTQSALQRQQALRTSLAALEADLREMLRRTEQRLDTVQRELAESIATTKREADSSLAAAKADVQKSLTSLAEDLEAARKFMLQTAQLGWLTQELGAENAGNIRKLAAASQDLSANSAKLAETIRQLSDSLASQLKDLATRLDTIQGTVGTIK